MNFLKVIQTLMTLLQFQRTFAPGTIPIQVSDALQKVLGIIENLNLQNPTSIEADIADLDILIKAVEAQVGHPINIGSLGDVLGIIEQYAASAQNLLNGQFVKAFEVTEHLGGEDHTFVIGALLKDGAAYKDLYGTN